MGDLDSHEAHAVRLANESECIVVNVDYRLAPEHRFPAAYDDCLAVTRWAHQNIDQLGRQHKRFAIGGDSAGGNLASGVALRARDEGKIKLAYQLLIYPANGLDFEAPSYKNNAEGYGLSSRGMIWFWEQYLNEKDKNNSYAVPHTAKSLAGLAPVVIITACCI